MSNEYFECIEHVVPGQHIRHYARGTSDSQEDELLLAVKQYRPRYGGEASPGDVTIIGGHASGFPKELYEPLWDALFHYTNKKGSFKIRNIWIADIANQGASGLLNEHKLGSEPSYFDHARDLLLMCNHFRKEMPRPIVGVAHSLGGCIVINLAILHPRLLTTVIAIEPAINKTALEMTYVGAYPLTFKRDQWSSREEAKKALTRHAIYKTWDPSVLALYTEYSLRDIPINASSGAARGTTLVTTKHQEVMSYARAAYPKPGTNLSTFQPSRTKHPDFDLVNRNRKNAFYQPSATQTYNLLPLLQPSCLYIAGEKTHMQSCTTKGLADKLAVTGTGVGGSGGHAEGKVQKHVVVDASHFLPFERPIETGQIVGSWLQKELDTWGQQEEIERKEMQEIPMEMRAKVSDDWKWWMNHLYGKKSKTAGKEKSKL